MKYKIEKYIDGNGKAIYIPKKKWLCFWRSFMQMTSSGGDFFEARFDNYEEASKFIKVEDTMYKSWDLQKVCDLSEGDKK